ncbi:MAG: Spo0B domain-containing protein [Clostridia bacterium]|nr:Spo0B domain-containing protein [Clostridia bacterium]
MSKPHRVDIAKTTVFVIVINSLQILMMAVILFLQFGVRGIHLRENHLRLLVLVACLVVSAGAAFDIRDALNTRRLLRDSSAMSSTIGHMTELNNTLRAQRHDFLNHLQVVGSLIELQEYDEAERYLEKIYGRVSAAGKAMKTANPAVNALLQVKLAACERAGIPVQLVIRSRWDDLVPEGWAMCKVLSNLIDNAIDAIGEGGEEALVHGLRIALTEDEKTCRFEIANGGPAIPADMLPRLFDAGVTTKAEGHGMGLYIVKTTLDECGGGITVRSSEGGETVFSGWVPRRGKENEA